jgi:hypothetical protein
MAYIGVQPTDTYLSIASQQITGTGSATYTLDYSVSNEEDVAVFVNNVRQNVSSYTVSGDQLTLGGTISASDECWVLFLGRTVGTKTPAVGSVTNDMLAGSIATSKLADGSTFATTNGITEADQWRINANFTGDNNPIASNWERCDTSAQGVLGTGMTQSGGYFTFPSTGFWFVRFTLTYFANNGDSRTDIGIYTSVNGAYTQVALSQVHGHSANSNLSYQTTSTETLVDVTDTSLVKVYFRNNDQNTSNTKLGDTTYNGTFATFIRLGDT